MAQPCTEDFVINVAGGEIPCEMKIGSDHKVHDYDVQNILAGVAVTIAFTYKVGKPKRTVFASSYTKSRTGGTPDTEPPDLGVRSFSRTPNENANPTDINDAQFTANVPAYSAAENNLGTGTDTYSIQIYLREANVRIGGQTPPANLEPPNPM